MCSQKQKVAKCIIYTTRSGHWLVVMINSWICVTTFLHYILTVFKWCHRAHVIHSQRFNSIKSNTFNYCLDRTADCSNYFLCLIPDFSTLSLSPHFPLRVSSLSPLNQRLYAELVLLLHLTPFSLPPFPPPLAPCIALALGRIQKF